VIADQLKATRGRVRTPKAAAKKQGLQQFCMKCLGVRCVFASLSGTNFVLFPIDN